MSLWKKVEETKSGLKVLAFGKSSVGKTTFGLSFPNIGAIDSEDGMAWYKDNPNLKLIINTTSADEVEEALEDLQGDYIDEIDTFIVDSETKIHENLQLSGLDVAERRARLKGQNVDDANLSFREYGKIKLTTKKLQSAKINLASRGKNVVSIAQEKDIKEKRGNDWVTVGHEYDANKDIDYDYDIIIRLTADKTGEVDKNGDDVHEFKGEIFKDRTGVTKRGQKIDNPSFAIWKDIYESRQGLKEDIKDYASDIEKDTKTMRSELESIEKLTERFKIGMKELKSDGQAKVKQKLKELDIDNPLQTDDIDGLEEAIKFMDSISEK